jgi:uncharacterized membrane protein YczE
VHEWLVGWKRTIVEIYFLLLAVMVGVVMMGAVIMGAMMMYVLD